MNVLSKIFPAIIEERLKNGKTKNSLSKHTSYLLPKDTVFPKTKKYNKSKSNFRDNKKT